MSVLQMQRISICALKKDRKPILEKLQSMGIMEISLSLDEDKDFQKMDTMNARMSFEKAAAAADQALDILESYAPVKKSMLSALEGKALVEKAVYQKVTDQKEELLKTANRLYALDKEKAELKANILKLENQMESLKPWLALDVPMNLTGTKKTALLLGTMPGTAGVEEIFRILAEKAPKTEGADVQIIASEPDTVYLAVLCMKTDVREVEEALRSAGFARPSQVWENQPVKEKVYLENQIKEIKGRISEIEKEIKGEATIREKLKILSDYYRVRAKKYEVLGQIPQTGRTFVISGYVPKQNAQEVEQLLNVNYDCVVDV